jgi:hypothetical protein
MIDNNLETQLQKALKECAFLRKENERLKKLLDLHPEDRAPASKPNISEPSTPYTSANQVINDSPIGTRIALFRSLLESVVQEASRNGAVLGVRISLVGEGLEEDRWTLPPSKKKKEKAIQGPFPEAVRVVQGNLIYIEKNGLPPAMLNRLIRLAAFQNPEFYKAQAMRL